MARGLDAGLARLKGWGFLGPRVSLPGVAVDLQHWARVVTLIADVNNRESPVPVNPSIRGSTWRCPGAG